MSTPAPVPAPQESPAVQPAQRLTVRALLLGDRIDTTGLERSDMISTVPFAFRTGENGFVVLFRYGVAVLGGMSPIEEDDVLRKLGPRVAGPLPRLDDEVAVMELTPERDDQVPPGGPVQVKDWSSGRLLVVADALAKSVALAHNERQVSAVFDVIDPLARDLARDGRVPVNRKSILKLIGEALLVDHRMSGRVAVDEKPDVLWDRPDLERLYARLEDEYELKERSHTLSRKLGVVQETARALTDLIDAQRSVRLEATIVALIVFEILITFWQMAFGLKG
ncbi:RMD1 family protein [Alsobacter sp. R-9]